MKQVSLFLGIAVFFSLFSCGKTDKKIHYNAFSHNDYTREHPLFDALHYRYNCAEADIHLIDNKLFVAHDFPQDISKIKTLEELYLAPLAQRIKETGGKVYANGDRPFYLMVDFKSEGDSTYAILQPILEKYREMFCCIDNGTYKEGPVLLFFSGNCPTETMSRQQTRFAFVDGKIDDLGKGIPASLMPVISNNYGDYFTWNGEGEMPATELELYRSIRDKTHKEGKQFRLWGAPDTDTFKRLMIQEKMDLIGEDNLVDLYNLLEK